MSKLLYLSAARVHIFVIAITLCYCGKVRPTNATVLVHAQLLINSSPHNAF